MLSKSSLISLEEAICWAYYEHQKVLESSQIPWDRFRLLRDLYHFLTLPEEEIEIIELEIE